MDRRLKYLASAGALGVIWFLALLGPLATRERLLPLGIGATGVGEQLVLVCVTSVLLAVAFKGLISGAKNVWIASVLSLFLPLVGTEIFVLLDFLVMQSENFARIGWSEMIQIAINQLVFAIPTVIHSAFYVVIPLGFISQYVMERVGRNGQVIPGLAFPLITLAVTILALGCGAWIKQLDGTRIVTRVMSWGYGPPVVQCPPGTKHIILRFVNFPDHAIGVCSRDLGRYLESLPTHEVAVTFELRYDVRSMTGFHEAKIGDLTKWDDEWGYYQEGGEGKRSPWDQ